ncbi:helix-turn-helix domain-containing protein [Caballeronia sp. LjRoot34]|uniref:helix-turn-helix domain-containing protein n=1 Tax=Caballeronia sp. LjRoot34 TaxID=3342325 RepID=UPI003ECD4892
MTAVFDRYPEGGGEMLVALKLADHADDDGSHIYPSIKYIAEKTRQSPRAVQYQIRRMEKTGFLILVAHAGGGRGKAREYRINPAWINGAELAPISDGLKGAENAPNGKGAIPAGKGATDDEKGANQSAKGRNSFAPESSGTTTESSGNHQPARRAPRVALHAELLNLELPEAIPFDVWDMWCEHREAKAKDGDAPWTRPAAKVSIKRLVKLFADGQSPEATIEEAVLRGWTGLFPVKVQTVGAPGTASAPDNWWKTESGYLARGQQLGIDRSKFKFFEQFKAKVCKASGPGEWMEDLLRTVSRESEERYEAMYAYFNDIPREKAPAVAA